MPTLQNDNTHRVYVDRGDGQMVKIGAGRAKNVEGKAADALKALSGVRVLTGDEAKAALEREASPSTGDGLDIGQAVAEGIAEINHLAVSAPLRVVVGDDQAPYGPPSGTVSTKGAEAAKSPEAARQFADGEATVVGKVGEQEQPFHGVPTHDVVHNEQVDSARAAEALAREIAGIGEDDDEGEAFDLSSASDEDIDGLSGEALEDAVRDAGVEGRSSMNAEQKREALKALRSAQ